MLTADTKGDVTNGVASWLCNSCKKRRNKRAKLATIVIDDEESRAQVPHKPLAPVARGQPVAKSKPQLATGPLSRIELPQSDNDAVWLSKSDLGDKRTSSMLTALSSAHLSTPITTLDQSDPTSDTVTLPYLFSTGYLDQGRAFLAPLVDMLAYQDRGKGIAHVLGMFYV